MQLSIFYQPPSTIATHTVVKQRLKIANPVENVEPHFPEKTKITDIVERYLFTNAQFSTPRLLHLCIDTLGSSQSITYQAKKGKLLRKIREQNIRVKKIQKGTKTCGLSENIITMIASVYNVSLYCN